MPAGHPDDAFFRAAAARMRERFAIGHVTLQAIDRAADDALRRRRRAGPSAAAGEPTLSDSDRRDDEVQGLLRDPRRAARGATQDDIKQAYRKLARKYHPDVSKLADAETRFKEINEANEVLKDPEKRAAYDQMGSNWKAGQDFQPPPNWDAGFEFRSGGPGGVRRRQPVRRRASTRATSSSRCSAGAARAARRRPAPARAASRARTTTPRS